MLVLAVLAAAPLLAAADPPVPPPPSFPVPRGEPFQLPRSAFPDVRVTVYFEAASAEEVVGTFTDVLRFPVAIDPAIAAAELPPVTVCFRGLRLADTLICIASIMDLALERRPDGTFTLVKRPPRNPVPFHGQDWDAFDHPFALTVRDLAPQELWRRLLQAGGPPLQPTLFLDPRAISMRAALPGGLATSGGLLSALFLGAPFDTGPHRCGLQTVVTTAFTGATVADALAAISRDAGLPCRLDAASGPMPRVSRTPAAIACADLLQEIAQAGGALVSEAADGMVVYRPSCRRWRDQRGRDRDDAGTEYRATRTPWWSYAERFVDAAPLPLGSPLLDRRIAVSWRDRPLRKVADDLQALLGVPVRLEVDDATRQLAVLLVLPDRSVRSLLCCLSFATGLDWQASPGGDAIIVTPKPIAEAPVPPPHHAGRPLPPGDS